MVSFLPRSRLLGLDGWNWDELKALPLSWFVGLAWVLRLLEDTGVWPDGLSGCLFHDDT